MNIICRIDSDSNFAHFLSLARPRVNEHSARAIYLSQLIPPGTLFDD